MDRRTWLAAVLGGGTLLLGRRLGAQQDSLAGTGETGTLRDPYSVGRPRARATEADNDEAVKRIEQKLKCTCGCSLDIFTCRTTDFTCETSPRLHRQVLGLHQAGFTEEQIIRQFVDQYGQQALMAPPARGFNLAGYVVPGAAIMAAGTALALYLTRQRPGQEEAAEAVPVVPGGAPAADPPTADELRRLEEAVRQDEE